MQTPSIGSIESSVGCRSIYCRFSGQEIPVPLIEGVFRVSVLWTSHRMRPCIAILSVLAILASTGSIGSMFRSRGRYRMKIVIVTCGTCTWEFWIIVCYMRREKSVFSRNYLRTLRGRQHLFKKKKIEIRQLWVRPVDWSICTLQVAWCIGRVFECILSCTILHTRNDRRLLHILRQGTERGLAAEGARDVAQYGCAHATN